jgi:hypothetical protein
MMMKFNDVQISLSGLNHRTPKHINYISLILVGWATYEPVIHDFIHNAPFGTIEAKEYLLLWFNWICPAMGMMLQFFHKNYEYNTGE